MVRVKGTDEIFKEGYCSLLKLYGRVNDDGKFM